MYGVAQQITTSAHIAVARVTCILSQGGIAMADPDLEPLLQQVRIYDIWQHSTVHDA